MAISALARLRATALHTNAYVATALLADRHARVRWHACGAPQPHELELLATFAQQLADEDTAAPDSSP